MTKEHEPIQHEMSYEEKLAIYPYKSIYDDPNLGAAITAARAVGAFGSSMVSRLLVDMYQPEQPSTAELQKKEAPKPEVTNTEPEQRVDFSDYAERVVGFRDAIRKPFSSSSREGSHADYVLRRFDSVRYAVLNVFKFAVSLHDGCGVLAYVANSGNLEAIDRGCDNDVVLELKRSREHYQKLTEQNAIRLDITSSSGFATPIIRREFLEDTASNFQSSKVAGGLKAITTTMFDNDLYEAMKEIFKS